MFLKLLYCSLKIEVTTEAQRYIKEPGKLNPFCRRLLPDYTLGRINLNPKARNGK